MNTNRASLFSSVIMAFVSISVIRGKNLICVHLWPNAGRFPDDSMFEMTAVELGNWRTQFATSNSERMGLRCSPFCFTEQGVAMLSSILNNETAIRANIQIIRVFSKMRELLLAHKDILLQLEKMEKKLTGHDEDIALIFEYLKKIAEPATNNPEQSRFQKKG